MTPPGTRICHLLRRHRPFIAACVALLACSTPGWAQARKDYSGDCLSSGCHGDLKKAAVVHAPISGGECDACHRPASKDAHRFELTMAAAELCLDCHDEYEGEHIHMPVGNGECSSCHNPHSSPHKKLLTESNIGELCAECHEETTEDLEFLHGPVAVGACTACHDAHASDRDHLLTADNGALCVGCHEDIKDGLADMAHVHAPAKDNCGGCHQPHGGANRMSLNANPPELCYSCHDDLAEAIEDDPVRHAPVTTGQSCAGCHDAHATEFGHILLKPSMDLCLSCHNKELKSGEKTVTNIASLLKENPFHHGPIKSKDCASCHQGHSGPDRRLLKGQYPKAFYSKFNEDAYALCFDCHDVEVFEEETTDDLTEFRNGERNLHQIHVNHPLKGRTCGACHLAHAAKNPKLIAASVPFGSWELPINFKQTETGGSCLPGCHRAYRYDREKPVANISR